MAADQCHGSIAEASAKMGLYSRARSASVCNWIMLFIGDIVKCKGKEYLRVSFVLL